MRKEQDDVGPLLNDLLLMMTQVDLQAVWIVKYEEFNHMVTHLDPHAEHRLFSGHSEDFINKF